MGKTIGNSHSNHPWCSPGDGERSGGKGQSGMPSVQAITGGFGGADTVTGFSDQVARECRAAESEPPKNLISRSWWFKLDRAVTLVLFFVFVGAGVSMSYLNTHAGQFADVEMRLQEQVEAAKLSAVPQELGERIRALELRVQVLETERKLAK